MATEEAPYKVIKTDDIFELREYAQAARDLQQPVIYGDASQPAVLHAAGLEAARALLITIPFTPDVGAVVRTARQIRPDIPIVARAEALDLDAVAPLDGRDDGLQPARRRGRANRGRDPGQRRPRCDLPRLADAQIGLAALHRISSAGARRNHAGAGVRSGGLHQHRLQ